MGEQEGRKRGRLPALDGSDDQARVAASLDIKALVESHARLEHLTQLAFALSGAIGRAEVARLVVEQGMRQAQADVATLYVLDERGEVLELVAEHGVAPEVLAKIARITATEGNPKVLDSLRSGRSLWAETPQDYDLIFPAVARTESTARRAKAFWSVPLIVEGNPVGLLGMGFYEERRFSSDDRRFVETFAKLCAQALLRAVRRDREFVARRWLATTLQSIGDAVIATDNEGRITFMNGVAERLTGWSEFEARERPLSEVFQIFSELTREVVESPVTKVLREGRIVGLANHTLLRAKNGIEIPIDDSGAPIADPAGEIYGVVLVFRDVTQEKRAEKRRAFLARAMETLASSLDYHTTLSRVAQFVVPELADWCTIDILEPGTQTSRQLAVAHADPAKVDYAREVGRRYPQDPNAVTGVPQVIRTGKSELYSEIPSELVEAAAQDEHHLTILLELKLQSAMVVALCGEGRRTLGAMTFIYADSGRRYTEEDLSFAEDFGRRAAQAIENARAVSELEVSRAREQAMREQAEAASIAKDHFLATVSHELRTPLNVILGWAVVLRERELGAEVQRALSVIERNARAQARLIEDVLDLSRITSGKLSLTLGPVNLVEAVRAAELALRPAAEARGVLVTVNTAGAAEDLTFSADADRVQQILWNLLNNAVKFTPRGGSVVLHGERVGTEIQIQVSDTGEGITATVLPYIFEPFRQADSSTTRRHGGLGLGLSLVKQIVAAHGGSVEASSGGSGRGATFLVRLPARTATLVVKPAAAPRVKALRADGAGPLAGIVIVVVDDEEDARELVGEAFETVGATVHLAGSAAQALKLIASVRPSVLVSDIGMPHQDGYALMRALRSLPADQGGQIPALALTAYARDADAELAFEAGYQRHIPKPVDPLLLVELVAGLVGRSTPVPRS